MDNTSSVPPARQEETAHHHEMDLSRVVEVLASNPAVRQTRHYIIVCWVPIQAVNNNDLRYTPQDTQGRCMLILE